jgi:uncharacterized protein YjbI with pentapeptide repeats
VLTPSSLLWWSARSEPSSKSALASALIGSGVVAFSVFFVEAVATRQRARLAERHDLQIRTSLQSNLSGTSFVGYDLSDFNLRGKNLSGASFHRANLCRADLTDSDLRGANFLGADLRWTRLVGADLRGATLSRAKLSYAEAFAADCRGADFRRADMRYIWLQDAICGPLPVADLDTFVEQKLPLKGQSRSELVSIGASHIAGLLLTSFEGANLRGAMLGGSDLTEADLSHANLWNARLNGASFKSPQIIAGLRMLAISLREAGIRSIFEAGGGMWRVSRKQSASLRHANLAETDLRRSSLSGVDLRGTDLRQARLDNTELSDAVADGNTQWPDSVDPIKRGVALAETTSLEPSAREPANSLEVLKKLIQGREEEARVRRALASGIRRLASANGVPAITEIATHLADSLEELAGDLLQSVSRPATMMEASEELMERSKVLDQKTIEFLREHTAAVSDVTAPDTDQSLPRHQPEDGARGDEGIADRLRRALVRVRSIRKRLSQRSTGRSSAS